ncbi:MAG: Serine/threonine kinase [Sarea resinae]|nr:MAG: Serine/threonine kinase [Sarea resinae]
MDDDHLINDVRWKIEREQALINGAKGLRQSSNNPDVQQRVDATIFEGNRNIKYLTERLNELQMRKMGQGAQGASTGSGSNGGPLPPVHGGGYGQQGNLRLGQTSAPPTPPPKDMRGGYGTDRGDYGDPGPGGYSDLSGGHMMPPRAPFSPQPPASGTPKARPNYSKLDLIKYDTPYVGPRIQLMRSQLQFKLSVEKQYKDGIEKMAHLYQVEGDKKIRADAEGRRIESNQKIQLLKHALKRYEDLHVDMESSVDAPDDDSLYTPNLRKPLTGQLSLRILAVKGVDHAATGRFARGPETFVIMKVEDYFKGRTKATRTDKWTDELHNIDINKANEIELTVYDKAGDHPLPIGMLWIRISDIAEEMRRKKIESEFINSGWVSADKMEAGGNGARPDLPFNAGSAQHYGGGGQPGQAQAQGQGNPQAQALAGPTPIDAWFALEPVGQIHLTMSFVKQTKDRRPFDIGLNRKGAIRQRKEEVHEMFGHRFVSQQFYNIMRCALCGGLLKYAAGMQCSDCKFTCHKECYPNVVTKCISKSNAETDPEEEKLNHRIPHRFEGFSNMGANWCCHCGYILPLGRKNCRKCTECGLTCHAQCAHLVPDFCGMPMDVANRLLAELKKAKMKQTSQSSMSTRTLRTSSGRPTPSSGQHSYAPSPGPEQQASQPVDQRRSYGQTQAFEQPPRTPPYGPPSATSREAAKVSYNVAPPSSPPQQQRPPSAQRTMSSQSAAAAAAAALAGKRTPSQKGPTPYQRSSTDYGGPGSRGSGGYAPSMDTHAETDQGYGQGRVPQNQPPQQAPYDPRKYAAVSGYQAQLPQPQEVAAPPQQPQKPVYNVTAPQPGPAQPVTAQPVAAQQEVAPRKDLQRRIGLDHFNFLAVLGKGNFGKVMLAETKSTKQLYAIKVLKKEFIIENDEVESTRSEKRVFLVANKERHPFLLNLHACFQTETRIYFVMEYIRGGDLMWHIQRGQFGTKRAQFYAAEVCLALKYFHENGVIYRDLKLDNILLSLDGHIKIGDYGLCKEEMWYGNTTSTFCGTPEFMAPEILLDKKYGRAVDWWAFGVLVYQMLLQQSPFRGEDEDEIYDAILADEPLYPIHMPRDSVSILQKLLTREPELRLGSGPTDAAEIMSQPFFRNVNWEDVYHKRIQPPFLPQITSATDTSNFDQEFTSVTPVLTPVQSVLSQAMQEEFRGFSYTADFV